ncbi:ADRENODOXIN [Encephalitozoon cuniculi GB-M1]|uniref:Adrenodoxin homolog n=3 Tax=Encephalitozoon cuniculi TaxID=6035 RepID=ADRX_ENCCU|nr:adrenodoxin [Encephalitozoon cuniculi GB-M1]Q8SV19.1 RecName: Full=Adrenodoxin homolog; AltName: Full=Ferredoxin [Encephalitozoon cuniculi GB-M1]AGE95894.1 adrenodoxin [Encephalitozoon cuniculi]KMV65784.1 adrenodoxin-like ferredoxin [Encephalitozoon cuniculi EcunIII-L]UYI27218.1 adrenodoxin [Encephalitozoon cuniculi]CAD25592.1 ADRENODOXIN [Encephalitozoon cuniculi GB-M1]
MDMFSAPDRIPEQIRIFFKTMKQVVPAKAVCGSTVLDVAHKNGVDLEGACEGNLACSTCHVILEEPLYRKLGEPSDKEYDLIDQAFGATGTSRLGCQLRVDKSFENAVFTVPRATKNMAVDGFKPKPH